jgi:hypothetical protein
MKELTAAQGLLRCGECGSTFDAMKSLSTTLPEDRQFLQQKEKELGADNQEDSQPSQTRKKIYLSQAKKESEQKQQQNKATVKALISSSGDSFQAKAPKRHKSHSSKFILIAVASLALLLLIQLLYNQKDWLADQPLTAGMTRAFCKVVGCNVNIRRDLTKLEMLNRNVYSHPNELDVLMITASIENRANFEQPYPLLEISFLSSSGDIVALRRFKPDEYLINTSPQAMMVPDKPVDLRIKITDPGKDAIRFQFRFL